MGRQRRVPGHGSPACAGMAPVAAGDDGRITGLPRLRGDGPDPRAPVSGVRAAPPPARGWPRLFGAVKWAWRGSPACAGMAPLQAGARHRPQRLPRLRGDGPPTGRGATHTAAAPPPARGWPRPTHDGVFRNSGSPACAGMAPARHPRRHGPRRLPRLRGDGPVFLGIGEGGGMAPPPARGWPPLHHFLPHRGGGSPACAGMAPAGFPPMPNARRLPRLRGDGPSASLPDRPQRRAPPPARGWPPLG